MPGGLIPSGFPHDVRPSHGDVHAVGVVDDGAEEEEPDDFGVSA
jgi:hypothetical protein